MNSIQVLTSELASSAGRSEDRILSLPEKRILVLADGFGGPSAGGGAAEKACEAIEQFLVHEAGDHEATMPFVMRSYFSLAGNVLFNAIVHANRLILRANSGKSVHDKGGASVVAAYLDEDILSIASVGSCMAWFFREGRMAPLLMPRTWGRLLDPSRVGDGPECQLPLMALGISEDLEPEVVEFRVRRGDRLWLGSFEPRAADLEVWSKGILQAGAPKNNIDKSTTYKTDQSWVLWEL